MSTCSAWREPINLQYCAPKAEGMGRGGEGAEVESQLSCKHKLGHPLQNLFGGRGTKPPLPTAS